MGMSRVLLEKGYFLTKYRHERSDIVVKIKKKGKFTFFTKYGHESRSTVVLREWGKYGHESRVFLEIGSYFDKIRALEKSFFRKNLKKRGILHNVWLLGVNLGH